MADYATHECFLNGNKFKIYVNFFRIPKKTNETEHCIMLLTEVYYKYIAIHWFPH